MRTFGRSWRVTAWMPCDDDAQIALEWSQPCESVPGDHALHRGCVPPAGRRPRPRPRSSPTRSTSPRPRAPSPSCPSCSRHAASSPSKRRLGRGRGVRRPGRGGHAGGPLRRLLDERTGLRLDGSRRLAPWRRGTRARARGTGRPPEASAHLCPAGGVRSGPARDGARMSPSQTRPAGGPSSARSTTYSGSDPSSAGCHGRPRIYG